MLSAYLVYYYKGEIKVKHGSVQNWKTFHPDNEYSWHTKIPYTFNSVYHGKVLVRNIEDIPKAKQMIKDYYKSRIDEANQRVATALNFIERIENLG